MNLRSEISSLMREHGFAIIRTGKHHVWSDGQHTIVTSVSPSCHRAVKNIRAQLARAKRSA